MGKKEVWTVQDDDGTIIRATPDHRFLCVDGAWRELREIVETNGKIYKISV
jgi:intein/homing endonuclease